MRILCLSRASLRPNGLMTTNRQYVYEAVTCSAHCMSTSFPMKDTWHHKTNFRALGKETKPLFYTIPIGSPRNYCTGQVKLSCWKCKQPLDNSPAFFCMSCKVVQPPDEGTSFFKIMDWWDLFIYLTWYTHHLTHANFIYQSVCEQKIHVTMCCLFSVTTLSHWTRKSCRKDICSSSGLCIQTTSARNLW